MADVFLIPDGPKNLSQLFPNIDWDDVESYTVSAIDDAGNVVATTVTNVLQCVPDQAVRIHFLNYLGTFDAVDFLKPSIVHEVTDSTYQKSLGYPLQKSDTGLERFNISSNDTYQTKTNCYGEDAMRWLQELFGSPKMFMEWTGTEGQPDDYLPIVLLEAKFDKQKNQDEFRYDVSIKFKLANPFISIRN